MNINGHTLGSLSTDFENESHYKLYLMMRCPDHDPNNIAVKVEDAQQYIRCMSLRISITSFMDFDIRHCPQIVHRPECGSAMIASYGTQWFKARTTRDETTIACMRSPIAM